jgi:multidrug efflux pump subunit AcrB
MPERCPTAIFPEINIPVVTVIWSYTGLSPREMEQRLTTCSQYPIRSNVNGIKSSEAPTLADLSVQKKLFLARGQSRPCIVQIASATDSIHALLPPGIKAPLVVQFNVSTAADQPSVPTR